jgi:hypothetical protein
MLFVNKLKEDSKSVAIPRTRKGGLEMRTNTLIGACLILLIAGPFAVDAQVNTTVETLRVPADGSSVTAKTRLKPRKIYYIIADGRVWDNESVGLLGDAEYDNISTEPRDTCGDGVTDTGIGINSRPIYFGGTGKKNRWGPFNGDNRYEMVWVIGKDDSSQVSFSYDRQRRFIPSVFQLP